MSNSLIFIDNRITNRTELLKQLPTDSRIIELNATQDGLQQITDAVSAYRNLDSIHIISHGSAGALYLGNSVLNSQTLPNYSSALGTIGNSLSATGDILLYGCNVAEGTTGAAFVAQLAQATGADVAASTDITGQGGDWDLEAKQGTIESQLLELKGIEALAVRDFTVLSQGTGIVTTDLGEWDDGRSLSLQADGKILLGGSSGGNFALVRYNPDGSLDTSFSGDGMLTTDLGSSDVGNSLSLQADGKILLGGSSGGNFALVRYNPDGSLDTSFSGDGMLTTYLGGYAIGNSLSLQADGKILLGGSQNSNVSDYDFALVRYNSDGSLDTSFSGDGILTTYLGNYLNVSQSLSLQADGKILLGGRSENGNGADFALVRYNPDGSLDTSFSGDGILTTDVGSGDNGYSLSLQADGKILLGGVSYNSNGADFTLVRYNPDGSLDTSFSGDGMLTTDLGRDDSGRSLSLQADGKILLGGYSGSSYPSSNFALVRYNTDGSLDTSFSGDGMLTTDLGGGDIGNSLSLQADGKILLGGYSYTENGSNFALVRYTPNGSVDTSFGADYHNPTGSLAINGTTTQGQTLTITNAITDPNGMNNNSLRYQWLADGQAISEAAGDTLTLTQAQVGKTISLQLDYTDGKGLSKSLLSAATSIVANINDVGIATITGTATQNQTLTASVSDADGLGTVAYQWLAGGEVIEGATASTFTLAQAQVGKTISVKASYTDAFGMAEVVTSAATTAVQNVNDAPTGSVTLTGTATQGQTLTAANTLANDADGMGTISYQWLADGRAINGATGETFTLEQAQVGKVISVKASYTDGQNTLETITSAATTAVQNVNDVPTGSVTLTGTATQGQTLTAANTLADVDGLGTVAYQWLADGVAITGATASTLTLAQAQVGKAISVKASYTDGQNTSESVTSAATTAVQNVNDAPSGSVTLTGTATQGQTLTAANTLGDVDGLGTVAYQWLADGVAISGATASTFALGQAQVGKAISVKASYTDGQNTLESVTSAATTAVQNVNDVPTGSVTLTGTATQGQTLTVINTLGDVDGLGTVAYQWLADGVAISGATASTFTLAQAQVGKAISVKASYTDGQNTSESVTSAATTAVQNVNDAPSGTVTLSGTATQGETLTAANTLADVDGLGTVAYQWLADGKDISGATSSTFTLGQAQVGKAISVKASYTDGQNTLESVTSAATTAVQNVNDVPTGSVTLTGTATQGQTLTVINTLGDVDGLGTVAYQWLADGVAISGATASTFALGQAQVGKAISVKASYTDGQNTLESVTSAATTAVQNVNDAPSGSVTLTGTATQGQTLTAANTLANDADGMGTISYQWLADGRAINGATGETFTLEQAQVGKAISVKASYTDGQNTLETITSAATTAVQNVNDAPSGSVTITGTATQGRTLTAASTLGDADGLGALSYTWLADGAVIDGATARTLQLMQAQVGKLISVRVNYTDAQGTAESITSSETNAVLNINDAPTGSVTISGLIQGSTLVGHQLTAVNTLADIDGLGAFTYQWLADGMAVRGATAEAFIPTILQQGREITVKIQYKDAFGVQESILSAPLELTADDQYGDAIRVGSRDLLQGGIFSSDLYGYSGNDELRGGAGDDRLYGGYGDDFLYGEADNDELEGDQGNDKIYGDAGNDTLTGGTGKDSLYGGDGNDVLDGSSDIDFMDGGNGADTYYVDNKGDVVRDSGTDSAKDVLYITAYLQGGYVLGAGIDNAVLSALANNAALTGNAGNNTLTGNTSANNLKGGVGIDTLKGGAGNDTLIGGAGKDVLNGGTGKDIFKLEKLIESGVTAAERDVVQGFVRGQDKLGLSALDANTAVAGDQSFDTIISKSATFTQAGQLQLKEGILYGNTDADAAAEFSIALTGITTLTLADIIA